MLGVEEWVAAFIQDYGYVALFILMAVETAMLLPFVPSEAIVPVATLLLATDQEGLLLVTLVSTLGATVGSLGVYFVARAGGRRFILANPRLFHVDPARLDRLEAIFRRRAGEWSVGVLRLVPVARALVSVPAGLARMSPWKFVAFTMTGCAIFDAILVYGTHAARSDPVLRERMRGLRETLPLGANLETLLGFLLFATLVVVWRRRRQYSMAPHAAITQAWSAMSTFCILAGSVFFVLAFLLPDTAVSASARLSGKAGAVAGLLGFEPATILLAGSLLAVATGLAGRSLAGRVHRTAARLFRGQG